MEASRPLAEPLRLDLTNISEIAIARMGQSEQRTCERHGENRLLLHIPDRLISRDTHAIISRDAAGQWRIRDMGSKNGVSVNGVRVRELPLVEDALLEIGATYFYFRVRASARHPRYLFDPPSTLTTLNTLLAANFRRIRELAPSMIPVLIRGETGTGKEVVARAVHELSGREGRLVAVNCGAIPENLLESELFGYVKGAFTDAQTDREGLFEVADGGTLFLDEIAELPLSLQVKLLRALVEKEIRRVGDTRMRPVDVRVVAATARDITTLVKEGTFREDLFYRLNVVAIHLPPLRARRSDVPLLVNHFVEKVAARLAIDDPQVSDDAMELLKAYDWPGNVRQLQSVLFRAAVYCEGNTLTAESFPQLCELLGEQDRPDGSHMHEGVGVMLYTEDGNLRPLEEIEADVIRLAIGHYRGRMTEVARRLGIGRSTLYRKLSDLGIDNAA